MILNPFRLSRRHVSNLLIAHDQPRLLMLVDTLTGGAIPRCHNIRVAYSPTLHQHKSVNEASRPMPLNVTSLRSKSLCVSVVVWFGLISRISVLAWTALQLGLMKAILFIVPMAMALHMHAGSSSKDAGASAGSAGVAGAKGSTGAPGSSAGAPGLKGDQGPMGKQGNAGPPGPSGFAGASGLKGDQGPKGKKGNTGPPGPVGFASASGKQGWLGEMGLGPPGPVGFASASGKQGWPGEMGLIGSFGLPGPPGPVGADQVVNLLK